MPPALPTSPGPHKVDVPTHQHTLFALEKAVMAATPLLYQFRDIEDFVYTLVTKRRCDTYIWNSDNGELVGLFAHFTHAKDHNTDELLLIIVHPDHQGKGYGKQMMRYYLELVKDKEKSVIATHSKNHNAIRFYESLGYSFVKELPGKYDDGELRVQLAKVL